MDCSMITRGRQRALQGLAADAAAWRDAGNQFAAVDHQHAVHHHIRDAFGVLRRLLEGGAVGDTLGVEDGQIGVGADTDASLALEAEAIGGHAHFLTLGAAFAVWAYLDRNLWFFGDEWDFLTRRGLHGAYFSIWTPHNEHWSVLPILLWQIGR